MARKAAETFEYIAPEDRSTVRMFTLKKHEITMMAVDEINKLKNQLIFVSMMDYNKVVAENKRLRELLNEKEKEEADKPSFISRQRASVELGLSPRKILSYADKGFIKTRKNGKYTYYSRTDLEKMSKELAPRKINLTK